jgi:uncharacterized protein YbaA (DUF1428 family)
MTTGIDVGFGWTKVVNGEKAFKFPSWLAYHTLFPISEVSVVQYGGKQYVVGGDVKYESQRIEIVGITELINYFPVFLKYIETITGKLDGIVTGIPIKYKNRVEELKGIIEETGIECDILPQGAGIFMDVEDRLGEETLILDIGFNTLDYLILRKENDDWKKKKGNTIEKFGTVRAVEIFRSNLPDEIAYARNFSFSRLLEVFEKETVRFEGDEINVSGVKKTAMEEYSEMIRTRMTEEIGDGLADMETVVLAGGGASIVKLDLFRHSRVIIPDKPEFSQARGYSRYVP